MVFPAVFALVVGVGMIGQWTASYLSRQIPELKTEPIRIGFHLVGEMVTAVTLIAAGIGLLIGAPWAVTVFLLGVITSYSIHYTKLYEQRCRRLRRPPPRRGVYPYRRLRSGL